MSPGWDIDGIINGWWGIVLALLLIAVAVLIPNRVPNYRILDIEGHQYIHIPHRSIIHSESCTNTVHFR